MNIEEVARRRKHSHYNDNRFYTMVDMAIIKKDAATRMAQIKRGEIPAFGNNYICVCGCGREGCFLHSGHDSLPQEQVNEWAKNRDPHATVKPVKPKTKKSDYKVDWKSKEFLDNYLKEMNETNK